MGNRTILSLGNCCEFEANNCLPIPWLALFHAEEFDVEVRRFESERTAQAESRIGLRQLLDAVKRVFGIGTTQGAEPRPTGQDEGLLVEECEVALFRTVAQDAVSRVEGSIGKVKGQTIAWSYLRTLELLRVELERCQPGEPVELDVTQLYWARQEGFKQRVIDGPTAFAGMLDRLMGDEQRDIAILDKMVNDYSLYPIASVVDLDPEDRMFVLLGTYWGERDDPYSGERFGDGFWTANTEGGEVTALAGDQ